MRERRTTFQGALALAVGSILLTASAAAAASGLPATIGMQPPDAAPGDTVEITGVDFPAGETVDLQVTTAAGSIHLATFDVTEGGYFRQPVTLPVDTPAGSWELRAMAADGTTAVHVFEAGTPPAALEPVAPATEATSTEVSSHGNSAADIMVMLIVALLISAVGGALAFAWYQTHGSTRQPGMGAGDDPIWSNAGDDPIFGGATFDTTR